MKKINNFGGDPTMKIIEMNKENYAEELENYINIFNFNSKCKITNLYLFLVFAKANTSKAV